MACIRLAVSSVAPARGTASRPRPDARAPPTDAYNFGGVTEDSEAPGASAPSEPAPKPFRFRSFLRWLPAAALALALVPAWTLFFSGGMLAVFGWLALISVGQLLAPLSLLALLVHAVRKRRFSRPMQATAALGTLGLWPGLWSLGILPIAFPYDLESARPGATVRLPSNEKLRVAWGGYRLATNYHAFTPDQRWAYDLVVEPAMHGSAELDDYGCYGTPVVAPVSARVHHAADGLPDHVPGETSRDFKSPLGNAVVLALETDTYLVLAHLKTGSVRVKTGDHVSEGAPIGLCGNSGNTSEPHIHIHHQRQDPTDRPLNFAEGLPLYFRDHGGPAMPKGGIEARDGKAVLTGDTIHHIAPD